MALKAKVAAIVGFNKIYYKEDINLFIQVISNNVATKCENRDKILICISEKEAKCMNSNKINVKKISLEDVSMFKHSFKVGRF